jgi:hypothetical protein
MGKMNKRRRLADDLRCQRPIVLKRGRNGGFAKHCNLKPQIAISQIRQIRQIRQVGQQLFHHMKLAVVNISLETLPLLRAIHPQQLDSELQSGPVYEPALTCHDVKIIGVLEINAVRAG